MNTTIATCSRQLLVVLFILASMLPAQQAMAVVANQRVIVIESLEGIPIVPGYSVVITGFYPAIKDEELALAAAGESLGLIALIDVYDAAGVPVATDVRSAPRGGMLFVSEGSRLHLLQYLSVPGAITTFCYQDDPLTDSDGDGIPDDQDRCPHSILGATVIIGDRDSGVRNPLFPDGCTLADLVQACADGARNHGQFLRCVAHLAQSLRKTGVLTQKEAAGLVHCAARARW